MTIIYCGGTMDWVGYAFETAKKILGDDMYVDTENQSADNLRVAMYHSSLSKGDEVS